MRVHEIALTYTYAYAHTYTYAYTYAYAYTYTYTYTFTYAYDIHVCVRISRTSPYLHMLCMYVWCVLVLVRACVLTTFFTTVHGHT